MLLGLVIGLVFMYFVLRPKLKATKEIDTRTEEQNKQLAAERDKLNEDVARTRFNLNRKNDELNVICQNISALKVREEELNSHIKKTRETIDNDNDIIYQKSFDLM